MNCIPVTITIKHSSNSIGGLDTADKLLLDIEESIVRKIEKECD